MPTTRDCPSTHALEQFLLGGLPAAQAEQVESHVLSCLECAGVLDALRAGPVERTVVSAFRPRRRGGRQGGAPGTVVPAPASWSSARWTAARWWFRAAKSNR